MPTSNTSDKTPKNVAFSVDDTRLVKKDAANRELRNYFGNSVKVAHVTFGLKRHSSSKGMQAVTDASDTAKTLRKRTSIAVAVTHTNLYDNPQQPNKVVVRVSAGSVSKTSMAGTFPIALQMAVKSVLREKNQRKTSTKLSTKRA